MKKEQIMDFTRRISQSNRGGLVIVIYDIFFAYMEDTKEAHDNGEWENYKTALRNASKTISELISSLDFSYELAGELYRIYVFCRETLAKAMYKRDLKEVELAENLMKKLYTAFAAASVLDNKLKEAEMDRLFYEIEMPLVFTLYEMESAGAIICAPSIQYIEQMDEKPEDYSQEDDAGLDLIDFYVLPHYLTAPFKKVTEKIMTEFSDLNLCPINNRQGIVIDGEGSKVICKD